MRLSWALLAGALVSGAAAQADLVERQNVDSTSVSSTAPETTSSAAGGDTTTTSDSGSGDTTTTSDGGSAGGDTTVTRTTTVTDDVKTVSRKTTTITTKTTTIVVTHTDFSTTTVTSRDQATATKTIYTTSTQWANSKRAIDISPRTLGPADAEAGAAVTSAPLPVSTAANVDNEGGFELVKVKKDLAKRATVTEVKTVTAGGGDATTVFDTVSQTVVRTKTSDETSTSVVTETDQADASTTTTVTSTLVVTSTSVTEGTSQPTSTDGSDSGSSGDSSSGDSSSSSGLSTGAKAGIGAGVGVGGLIILIALAWFLIRRRRRGPKPDPDDMYGASEVPVGGPVGGNTPPMSQHSQAAAAFLAPHRTPPKKASSPEGYRGTAKGDGRAGYAKPEPYGAAYAQPTNRSSTLISTGSTNPSAGAGADYLPEHPHPAPAEMADTAAARPAPATLSPHAAELGPSGGGQKWHVTNAAEMDSTPSPVSPAAANARSPPPADNVYEMPAQNY